MVTLEDNQTERCDLSRINNTLRQRQEHNAGDVIFNLNEQHFILKINRDCYR